MTRASRSLLAIAALGLLAACIDGISPRINQRFAAILTGAKERPVLLESTALGAFIAEARDTGTTYVNIHSVTFPDGELRGQIELLR